MDIETAPHVVYCWNLFDERVPIDRIISTGYTLCYAAKWYGSEEVIFDSVKNSGAKKMLKGVHDLLNEADAVIHYNGTSFDVPTLNKEFLVHGMGPPAPYRQIDMYRVVRATFRFASKKLDWVTRELGFEGKVKHKGMEMWTGCMAGDIESWAVMEKYNRQDVTELEKVYERIRPWIRIHPNAGVYDEPGLPVCPNCGSGEVQRRGYAITSIGKYGRYQCKPCGKWSRDSFQELPKEDRQNILRPVS